MAMYEKKLEVNGNEGGKKDGKKVNEMFPRNKMISNKLGKLRARERERGKKSNKRSINVGEKKEREEERTRELKKLLSSLCTASAVKQPS